MPFIPHTKKDIELMLETIGVSKIDQLFDEIPEQIPTAEVNLTAGMSELVITNQMKALGQKNQLQKCFIGAGAYEHFIPAAVWEIVTRGEYYSAYTPYQAEASQGSLQVIYEYQTMICNLLGMDVANASLYDGATSLAEAVLMAVRIKNKNQILVPKNIHPTYRKVLKTLVKQQNIQLIEIPYNNETGINTISNIEKYINEDCAALIISQPNFFGCLESVDELTQYAHDKNLLVIAIVNPLAMALLKEPGSWGTRGADIVCGEGQPFGVPLASGGPYFGFMSCKKDYIRQLPGRVVGQTQDAKGQIGYCLTLQTREQHIRRAKATSNICTNQGLMVTAATIYMSLLGTEGLKRVATLCHQNADALKNLLKDEQDIKIVFNQPFFHEFVIQTSVPASVVLQQLSKNGILGGYDLTKNYPELDNCILIAVTETKCREDCVYYHDQLKKILAHHHAQAMKTN